MEPEEYKKLLTQVRLDASKVAEDHRQKYVYFLMGIVAACIAFGVSETRNASFSFSMIPLFAAWVFWGISFYAGCRMQHALLKHHSAYLDGIYHLYNHDPASRQASSGAMDQYADEMQRWYNKLFRYLVAGAICFMSWHVLSMILRAARVLTTQPS